MGKTVKCSGNHLFFRDTVCIYRIHKRKYGITFCIVVPDLYFCLFISDHCRAIAFTSCSRSSRYHPHRNRREIHDSLSPPEFFPRVAAASGSQGNRLGTVHYGASAKPEDQINVVFFNKIYSLQNFLVCRIRHDSGKINYILPICHQDVQYFIIDAIFFR